MKFARGLLATFAASALVTFASGPASAQDLGTAAKCFIVSNMFAKSTDPKAKQAAVQASYFYLGRLAGSTSQVEAALAAQGKTLNPKNASATMAGCARAVAQKATEVRAIGQRLGHAQPPGR